jgi:hypothetical protein
MSEDYRKALDNRIKAKKVHLNNKQTLITAYFERGADSIVIVEGKEHILTENDNLIMNGYEKRLIGNSDFVQTS